MTHRLILPVLASLVLSGLTAAGPLGAQETPRGAVGAYLAARMAMTEGEHRIAAGYFDRLLAVTEPDHALITNGILAHAGLGQWARAAEIARQFPITGEGRELPDLVLFVDLLAQGAAKGDTALEAIAKGQGAGPLVNDLAEAWLSLGQGQMDRATEAFLRLRNDPGLADIALYHLALARGMVGDFEGADAIFSGAEFGPAALTLRGLQAHAQVLVQLDRKDEAIALLDELLSAGRNPEIEALRARLISENAPAYDFIVTPEQGLAEVFFTLAQAIGTEAGTTLPLIYARAAYAISQDHHAALILAGDLLSQGRKYALAAESFARVPADDPLFLEAELGRAAALFEDGARADGVAALRALLSRFPDHFAIHASLGDMLRRMEQFEDAAAAYSGAIDLINREDPRFWFLFYTRGISFERSDQWEAAEADFRHALTLSPDQADVLNYLGYSLVEQRRNFDEALAMIERAVELEPESGYIIDSLGWVFFRLGRYAEAVAPMERAVELLPNDPIINDHLGDVYWKVGRLREARFQWERALSFDPEDAEAERIRRKLDLGLDRVLEEEGQTP